jgi:thiosulfate/3-mercaptopyruvate sulfurtransferase
MPSTQNDSQQHQGGGPFVDGAWLEQRIDDPGVRVLDTRGRVPAPGEAPASMLDEYVAGHVPGASFVVWNVDFVDADDPVPNQLASPERFEQAARRLGIDDDTLVVCCDDYHSIFAGRLWWAFRAMGHDRVRVLDGGWRGWIRDGRPVEQGHGPVPAAAPGTFRARPRPELRWKLDDVAQRDRDQTVLVDARSRARFAGTGGDAVGGHVPGAVNAPYAELVDEDGFLRPDDELRRVLAAAGIDVDAPPRQLVGTCGSGISASVPLLAIEQLAPGVGVRGAIYDGSWAEWSRSGLDVATGPARR